MVENLILPRLPFQSPLIEARFFGGPIIAVCVFCFGFLQVGDVRVGVFPKREETTTCVIASYVCVTEVRTEHRAEAPRRIRSENAGRPWSCGQVKTGTSKSYRT